MVLSLGRGLRSKTLAAVLAGLGTPSSFLFAGLMLGNVLAYLYQVFMARMLAPADYGLLVTVTSVSTILLVFTRTIQAWVIEAVAPSGGRGAGLTGARFAALARPVLLAGGVALVLHLLASGWIAAFLQVPTRTIVLLLGLYAATSFLVAVPRGALMGLDRFYLAGVVYAVEPFARALVGVGLVAWGWSVNGAFAAFTAGNVVALAVGLVPLRPALRRSRESAPRRPDVGGLDRYALLALGVNVALVVMSSVDQIAVRHFFSAEVTGNYAVAFLLGRVISTSTISLGWVIFARSAVLPPDDPGRPRLLLRGILATGGIAVLLTAGYLLRPALPVHLLGGARYAGADSYVGLVGIETTLLSLVYVQAYYQISVKKMAVVWPLGLATVLQIALLGYFHASVQQVLVTLIVVLAGLLGWVSLLSWRALRAGRRSWAGDRGPGTSSEGVAVL